MKRSSLAVATLIFVTLLSLGAARAQDSETEQRSRFIGYVEDKISTPDRQIRIGRIDGVLSSDVRIDEITIADRTGVWLKIEGAHLVWSRLALFTGKLSIDLLEAQSIEMLRRPAPPQGFEAAAPGPFQVPVLPVSVEITKLTVPKVALPADLVGQPAVLAVDGSIKLADGALDSKLTVDRTDGATGRLAFAATYANDTKQIGLDLEFSEPRNGLLSTALGIEGRPSLDFKIKGAGPLDSFAADIGLTANEQQLLAGKTTIARVDKGFHVTTNLAGSIAPLVPAAYDDFFAGQSSLMIDATRGDDGTIKVDRANVASGVMSVALSGALGADGFPTAIHAKGQVGGTAKSVLLPGPDGKRVQSAAFEIAFGDTANQWSANFAVIDLQTPDVRIPKAVIEAGGDAMNLTDAKTRSLTFLANGRVEGLTSPNPALAKALGPLFTLMTKGSWQAGAPVTISEASIANANASAGFVGAYNENGFDGAFVVKAADLAPFAGIAGSDLKGGIDLKAAGNVFPVAGTFSLRLDGSADNLAVGKPAIDPLLRGTTQLSGILSRSEDGLHFTKLDVANPRIHALLDGSYGRKQSDLSANIHLADLASVTDRGSGAVDVTARLDGPNDHAALTATLDAPSLQLQGRPFRDGLVAFKGTLSGTDLDGDVTLGGKLGGVPINGSATIASLPDGVKQLTNLVIKAGATTASGAITAAPGGTVTGNVQVKSPDIGVVAPLFLAKASGAVDAALSLSADGARQNAAVKATARNFRVETLTIGSADVDLTIGDLLGTRSITGKIGAMKIATPAVTIPRLSATASPDGAATRFNVDADLVRPGLPSLKLGATGRVQQEIVALDARLTGAGGIDVRAQGTTPFSGDRLAFTVTGTVPLALANPSLAARGARLAGNVAINARVGGSLAAPDVTGTATASGASFDDPQSSTRLTAIALGVSFTGNRAVIERFSAAVGGGTLAATGTIGFAPGSNLPIELSITARNAKLSDGEIATAVLSGGIKLSGALLGQMLLAGDINAQRIDITLPEKLSAGASFLDIRHKKPSPALRRTLQKVGAASGNSVRKASGVAALSFDLAVNAPAKVTVRGRGVDAELGGTLRLKGSMDNIQPTGGFDLIRGRLDVIGQEITLSRGRVTLVGDLDPFIEFTAESNRNNITVGVTVTGRVSDLQIQLTSTPSLPQDEILSQFLFGKSIAELSPFQIVQITSAVLQLAGGGSGGDGLIGQIRKSTGLDQLDIVTGQDGSVGVRVGRYIGDNARIGVTAGSGGANATIDLDITKNVKARAEAGSDVGDTTTTSGQSGGKLGIYYEKEY